ncbi:nucleotidyltransferase family protein [Methanosarcina sp. Z-7115]|uniref:Nucleotidyltransferase family protein n=1 Tax=Methanosarcina baikalica TaxID=3073890 RepID=A0ABU2D1X6_9EURY|nr:nucleotidyltransferase family protein [Methanosarcina sp. Z-7115]MDR7665942.1 nucleotidyltransferase family protein [Methanosarcina sp. Z-7115]
MVQLSLSSEDKLLLYCSRLSISEDIKCKIEEILSNVLDWNYIVDCSIKQGISPLFYWNLKKISNGKDVPSEVMKNLEKMYYSNLARNMLLYDELSKILTAFKKTGIDTIVLKGAFLAEEIYKNIGLRPMSDIDLLIKEKDLQKAKKELTELKYSATSIFPTKLHEQFQTVWNEELPFIHQNKKTIIEIHWDILPHESPYKVDINKFWNNAKTVKIAGIETLMLAPEDMLQHLCLHLDKHINSSVSPQIFKDYCDIAEVTRYYKNTLNWNYFLQSSKDYKIEEPIFHGLSIANKYFEAFIPENTLSELQTIKSDIGFEEIFKEAMEGNSDKKYSWINYVMNLKKIDGTWKKTLFLFGNVFPSKEFMIYRYPIKNEKQVYLYYLIRLGTFLHFGLLTLWQLPHYLLRSTFGK